LSPLLRAEDENTHERPTGLRRDAGPARGGPISPASLGVAETCQEWRPRGDWYLRKFASFLLVHEPFFAQAPTLVRHVDFEGRRIRVSVWYAPNSGPEASGFGAIPYIGLDPRVRGFPVIKVEVDSTGQGYVNWYGWIQVIAHLREDGSYEDWSPDPIPALRDRGVPFCALGYHPTIYDAPFFPGRPRIHWRADLFLTPLTIFRPAEEDIVPIVGLRWGFRIHQPGGEPELLPLQVVGSAEWDEALPHLKYWYPSWRFAPGNENRRP
jgi:hypothetical protein